MKGAKKVFRSRAAGSSDEEDGGGAAVLSVVAVKVKKPKKPKGPISLGLSFGDGDAAMDVSCPVQKGWAGLSPFPRLQFF
jgi:hypothetical protein